MKAGPGLCFSLLIQQNGSCLNTVKMRQCLREVVETSSSVKGGEGAAGLTHGLRAGGSAGAF